MADPTAGGGYRQAALGGADDALKAAGDAVLDYRQAEAKARDWIARRHRVAAGQEPEPSTTPVKPYNVRDAISDYLTDLAARGGKGTTQARIASGAHIIPSLGDTPVTRLTREGLKQWHRALAASPPRLRGKNGAIRHREVNPDPEAARPRQASANRILTILKAALNHARVEGKVTCSADAWAAVQPFRQADKAKVRYLLDDELTRLMNACPRDFRELVTAALLTGCRYGELAAMKAGDFDPQAGTVIIAQSKSGRSRHVVLTEEGRAFFCRQTVGKLGAALMFERDTIVKQATREREVQIARAAWGKSHQCRVLREACTIAKISPAISFHILRHTYASRLAMRGAPMPVIAAQLGHTDTRMTERHYAHLGPSYVAETVRRTFGELGITIPTDGAVPLRRAG
jgi:integrase